MSIGQRGIGRRAVLKRSLLAAASALPRPPIAQAASRVLRFVPDNHDRSRSVLKDLSIPFAESEVFLVELKNQPGELRAMSLRPHHHQHRRQQQ